MANLSKQYDFLEGEIAQPAEVNTNFDDIIAFLLNQTVHVDGTKSMTGHLNLPAADPTTANQATRKSYVDAQDVAIQNATAVYADNHIATAKAQAIATAAGDATTKADAAYNNGVAWTNLSHVARISTPILGTYSSQPYFLAGGHNAGTTDGNGDLQITHAPFAGILGVTAVAYDKPGVWNPGDFVEANVSIRDVTVGGFKARVVNSTNGISMAGLPVAVSWTLIGW